MKISKYKLKKIKSLLRTLIPYISKRGFNASFFLNLFSIIMIIIIFIINMNVYYFIIIKIIKIMQSQYDANNVISFPRGT